MALVISLEAISSLCVEKSHGVRRLWRGLAPPVGRGRRRLVCNDACWQRAYRRRQRTQAELVALRRLVPASLGGSYASSLRRLRPRRRPHRRARGDVGLLPGPCQCPYASSRSQTARAPGAARRAAARRHLVTLPAPVIFWLT